MEADLSGPDNGSVTSPPPSRLLPAGILVGAALLCLGYAFLSRPGGVGEGARPGGEAGSATREALEQAIAAGRATADTWFAYARTLTAAGEHDLAARACRRALAEAPYRTDIPILLAAALARAERTDDLLAMLDNLALDNAKLAVEIMRRPDLAKFLPDPRFQAVLAQAEDQAND